MTKIKTGGWDHEKPTTDIFGWEPRPLVISAPKPHKDQLMGKVFLFAQKPSQSILKRSIPCETSPWQYPQIDDNQISFLASANGPVWIALLPEEEANQEDSLGQSLFSGARDLMWKLLDKLTNAKIKEVMIKANDLAEAQERGVLTGLEIALYQYKKCRGIDNTQNTLSFHFDGFSEKALHVGLNLGLSCNLTRHLVNTPASELTPQTFEACTKSLLKEYHELCTITTWDQQKLHDEGMHLLSSVGKGSCHPPLFLHVRYRPKEAQKEIKPLAFVGKGITFDSGGLDIKSADGMRLMKKDMGGAAAILGLCFWMVTEKIPLPADFYFALAENAISKDSYRPGDVLLSRTGKSIEVHNTDAEGRLAIADLLDIACKSTDKPQAVFSIATLTGAAKVALGTDIASFFTDSPDLVKKINRASRQYGDLAWRMPLFKKYENQLQSQVADLTNCSSSRFGGAITAALFLNRFIEHTPFAHFDIYGWTDQQQGAYSEIGGNGQGVQLLAGIVASYLSSECDS